LALLWIVEKSPAAFRDTFFFRPTAMRLIHDFHRKLPLSQPAI